MQDFYQRLQFDRLIVLSALATTGVLLTLRAAMPLLLVAVVVLLGVVTAALRQVMAPRGGEAARLLTPLLLTLANILFWRIIPDERASLIGCALFGLLFLLALVDYHRRSAQRGAETAAWPNQAVVYVTLFMFCATFSAWNLNLVLYAALAGAAACAASMSVLLHRNIPRGAALRYSLLVAVAVGEVSWALNYWPLPTLQEALALLLHVHVVLGIVQAHHARKLGFAQVVEYGAVCAIAAALILWTTLRALA